MLLLLAAIHSRTSWIVPPGGCAGGLLGTHLGVIKLPIAALLKALGLVLVIAGLKLIFAKP